MVQPFVVTRGAAVLKGDGLRCAASRVGDPSQICNKLLAKVNDLKQIAGNFRCDRCKSEIEIQIIKI
jgi:hypothetical protein